MLRGLDERRGCLAALERGLADPRRRLIDKRLRVEDLTMRLASAQSGLLAAKRLETQKLSGALKALNPRLALFGARARHREAAGRMLRQMIERLRRDRDRVEALRGQLRALGPLKVLGRGYSLVFDQNERILRQSSQTGPGREIKVRLAEGSLKARVEEILE